MCEEIDSAWQGELPVFTAPKGLPEGAALYIKDNCMFSRWALYARANLHLQDVLPVVNVSRDPEARAKLERIGGKSQAPALVVGEQAMYESAEIAKFLAGCGSWC